MGVVKGGCNRVGTGRATVGEAVGASIQLTSPKRSEYSRPYHACQQALHATLRESLATMCKNSVQTACKNQEEALIRSSSALVPVLLIVHSGGILNYS